MGAKIGKKGSALVLPQEDGSKVSFTNTPAGLRASKHIGGITIPVDPAEYDVHELRSSSVGGGHSRVTVRDANGVATDYTPHVGGVSEVVHHGPNSKKR